MTRRIVPLLLTITLLLAAAPFTSTSRAAAAPDEHWKGTIQLPGDQVLEFVIHFQSDAATPDAWTAALDIPVQGVNGAKMSAVTYTDKQIAFSFAQVGAVFEATLNEDGQTATGTLKQSGMTLPIELQRRTAEQLLEAKPKRPQTPQPPFPYEARDVTYKNEIDGITIAGTLTLPPGEGPFPAVVMITGSGPQDRDEALMEHQPFWVIADHLSRHGIAVLRADDRGVGGTGGDIVTSTTADFANDALAGVNFLKTVEGINPDHIGVMGHSEGGIIGPMGAAQSKDVAFVVMLAGTGLPGRDILAMQSRLMLKATGAFSEEALDHMEAKHRAAIASIINGDLREDQIKAMVALMRSQGSQASDDMLKTAAAQQVEAMNSPWMRYFLTLDPRPTLAKVTCPVLALNGSLDLQVPPDEDLDEISKALTAAGNKDFTIKKLDGLNHLFQHATTGSPLEYATIEETFSPEALRIITNWINARFGRKGQGAEEIITAQ